MVLYNMRNRMIATAGSAIASIPYRNQAIAARFGYGYKERYLAEVNGSYTGSENLLPDIVSVSSRLLLWVGSFQTNRFSRI